jgi:anti-anti-sigma factor
MRIKTQDYNDVTVIELQGDFDGDFAELFQQTLSDIVARDRTGIVLDMSAAGFVDSRGLEQLLWSRDYCSENRCEFRLAGLDENCTKILEITRLDGQFDCCAELAEAVKSFA